MRGGRGEGARTGRKGADVVEVELEGVRGVGGQGGRGGVGEGQAGAVELGREGHCCWWCCLVGLGCWWVCVCESEEQM